MNSKDPFAVAVVKSQVAVGHIPRKISSICSMFLRHGGTICCRVTGSRRYSQDLPQGGLEIPCMLTFRGEAKDIENERFLAARNFRGSIRWPVRAVFTSNFQFQNCTLHTSKSHSAHFEIPNCALHTSKSHIAHFEIPNCALHTSKSHIAHFQTPNCTLHTSKSHIVHFQIQSCTLRISKLRTSNCALLKLARPLLARC